MNDPVLQGSEVKAVEVGGPCITAADADFVEAGHEGDSEVDRGDVLSRC